MRSEQLVGSEDEVAGTGERILGVGSIKAAV
jgi:hypothetical protein